MSRARGAAVRLDDAADSRERIHRVALALFARYGYEGVSLQQIADEVGLHKSSLFHHYRNKDELRNEVIEEVVEGVLGCVRPLLEGKAELTIDAFLDALDRLVDHFSDRPDAARLLVMAMSAPDDSDLRRGPATARVMEFYVSLVTFLERARRQGVIRRINIRQAIPNLIGLVLFYPTVAGDLAQLVGTEPFSPRAREVRKAELRIIVRAMLSP